MTFNNVIIIFNGEIYNISELKKIIKKYGLKLKTKSDTELIIRMYEIFGTDCVKQFEGMVFLILDKKRFCFFIKR